MHHPNAFPASIARIPDHNVENVTLESFVFQNVKNLVEELLLDSKGCNLALVMLHLDRASFKNVKTGKESIKKVTWIEGCVDITFNNE